MSDSISRPLIVHIVYRFDIGGLENGIVNLINSLPENKYRHAIICLTDYSDFITRIKKKNIEIYALHKKEGNDFKMYLRLWKLLKRLKPSLVHTRNFATMDCHIATILFRNIYRIHGEHGWDMVDLTGNNKKHILLRKVFSFFIDQYIVLSSQSGSYLTSKIGISPTRIKQIYNGVDTDKFRQRNYTYQSNSHKVIFGVVGRLAEVKNQLFVIKVINELLLKYPKYKEKFEVHIVGDGPLYEMIRQCIVDYNVERNCKLLGKSNEVSELMQTFDVFVLPSLAEGISNTILEAMSCGVPVIASNVGGNSELVDEGKTGALYSVNNNNELIKLIKQYIENNEMRILQGKNARLRIEEKFSLNKMVEQYTQIYDAVLKT